MAKPRTAEDYDDDVTATSRSAPDELVVALGSYRDALVLIGGWEPYLILEVFGDDDTSETAFLHVGSIDIDFVVDPTIIDAERYATLVELLADRGDEPVADSRYQFERTMRSPRRGAPHAIRVDFLTPRSLAGQGRKHRHRAVQRDLQARTLGGAEVALTHWFWYDLEATLPDGGQAYTRVKVTGHVTQRARRGSPTSSASPVPRSTTGSSPTPR